MFTVTDAGRLAAEAHAGQVDKLGRDYFNAHLVPIAEAVAHLGEHAVCAAYLHDIIEDTDWDADGLRDAGVPESVVATVVSVTRMPGETYDDLIARSCADPLGVHIKLADNTHNIASNPALAVVDQEKAHNLLMGRYLPARDRLIEARARHDSASTTV